MNEFQNQKEYDLNNQITNFQTNTMQSWDLVLQISFFFKLSIP